MEKSCKKDTEIQEYCCWHKNCDYFCSEKQNKGEKNYGNSNQSNTDALRGGSPSFP